jgi:regulator of nonsense transcripts 1
VGDQKQLPPTVKSRAAERGGLATSLFVRLQAMGLKPLLLDTQYRM